MDIKSLAHRPKRLLDMIAMWLKPKRDCKKCCLFCPWYDACSQEQNGQDSKFEVK